VRKRRLVKYQIKILTKVGKQIVAVKVVYKKALISSKEDKISIQVEVTAIAYLNLLKDAVRKMFNYRRKNRYP
jgi:hypothetical protein